MAQIQARGTDLRQRYGHLFTGVETDWITIRKVLEWTGQVREILGSRNPPASFLDRVCHPGISRQALTPLADRVYSAHQRFLSMLQHLDRYIDLQAVRLFEQPIRFTPLAMVRGWFRSLFQNIDRLAEWMEYTERRVSRGRSMHSKP
jgi:hypothetical protein